MCEVNDLQGQPYYDTVPSATHRVHDRVPELIAPLDYRICEGVRVQTQHDLLVTMDTDKKYTLTHPAKETRHLKICHNL